MSEGTITNFRVVGGAMHMTALTAKLDERSYEIFKAAFWLEMLKEGKRPERWYKAGKNGTKVNFAVIQSQLEADTAMGELKGYIDGLNKKYPGAGLELETYPKEKSVTSETVESQPHSVTH